MKIEVLGNEKTVIAFSLAGIGGRVVTSKEEVLKIVRNSGKTGVFLVMDTYYPYDYDEDFPILIMIPGRR